MRQPYRNLFGSCLLAALILPSFPSGAAPLQDTSADPRADFGTVARSGANTVPAGLQSQDKIPGDVADGLQDSVTTGKVFGPAREPVLGRIQRQPGPGDTSPVILAPGAGGPIRTARPATKEAAGAALIASSAQAAPITDSPAKPGAPAFNLPAPASSGATAPGASTPGASAPGAAGPGSATPAQGPSAQHPPLPAALIEALTALSQKKPDDAVRVARTFISQADAKGPGPDNTPPNLALAYEIVATGYAVQGKQDEAIAELKKALSIYPGQTSAMFKLGVIYREQGRLAESRTYLEKAVANGGGDPIKQYLGDVVERLGDIPAALALYEPMLTTTRANDLKFKIHVGTLYDRVNRFADAIKLLQPLVPPDSKEVDGLLALGFAYGGSGKPKEAIPLLLSAKTFAPDNWRVDLALGTSQREVGDFDAAITSLKHVVAVEPKQVQARFQLALAQMAKSQYPEAVENLTEASKLVPRSPEIKQVLGDALFRAGNKDEAIAQFKELTARDGATLNDSVNLARIYQAVGRTDDAVQVYRAAAVKFPSNPVVYAQLALLQAQQKKFADARETIAGARKATPDDPRLLRALVEIETAAGQPKAALPVAQHLVDIQPKSLDDRYNLAVLYGQIGDNKRAIDLYKALLADAPTNVVILNNLAAVMADSGDAKGAVPLARKAVEMQPESPAVNDTLGWALVKNGQAKDALPVLELASKLAPNNAELLYHLAIAQKALNNPTQARANLEKALAMNSDFNGSADAKAALATLSK